MNLPLATALVGAWLFATSSATLASGLMREQSASGLGTAYAGRAASAEDASTVFSNPAGMTRLPDKQVVLVISAVRTSARFSNSGTAPAPYQTSIGNDGLNGAELAVLPALYLAWRVNPRWHVGLAVNSPFALETSYDPGWMGRFYAVDSRLETVNVATSLAFKASDTVSLGVGIDYQHARLAFNRAANYTYDYASGSCPLGITARAACFDVFSRSIGYGREGMLRVTADDAAWGYHFGVLLSPGSATRIGLAYRSSIHHKLEGSAAFENRPALAANIDADGPVTADLKLPASASLSVFTALSTKFDVVADLTWTQWAALDELAIQRTSGSSLSSTALHWRNTFRPSIGINYHPGSAWTWRAGLAYEPAPTRGATWSPAFPVSRTTWLALGGRHRPAPLTAIDFAIGYALTRSAGVDLCGYQYAVANPASCSGRPVLVGSARGHGATIAVQLQQSF